MKDTSAIDKLLSAYSETVFTHAQYLRHIILKNLPGIEEQVDFPAKIIGYSFGKRYMDTVCVLIPSKKGLKLGFNQGVELPDPKSVLKGSGKISRYLEINKAEDINVKILTTLLKEALKLYEIRIKKNSNQNLEPG